MMSIQHKKNVSVFEVENAVGTRVSNSSSIRQRLHGRDSWWEHLEESVALTFVLRPGNVLASAKLIMSMSQYASMHPISKHAGLLPVSACLPSAHTCTPFPPDHMKYRPSPVYAPNTRNRPAAAAVRCRRPYLRTRPVRVRGSVPGPDLRPDLAAEKA